MSEALRTVAAALRAEGGLVAACAADPPAGTPQELAERIGAATPRHERLGAVIEALDEAARLHYAPRVPAPRIVRTDDEDLALLAGDRLYALGLGWLAEDGDLGSVGILADTIATVAQAQQEGDVERAERAFVAAAEVLGDPGARTTLGER